MERKLYDAAVEGNVNSLLSLLQEDALLLDRFIIRHYPETPLHVASMLGHVDFVDQLLSRKPELAKELDSRNSSPLHLATAKGYLDIVRRLLQANPDMCLVCDHDGRNPVHIAAIKGRLDVLRELVNARPWVARLLMDEGETILHACVRYNQLEALKLLVERVSDHDFLNCKNYDGNTIFHLAIAAKQTEAINFMITSTTVDVNCQNADGFTALDLLSQNQRDVKEREIAESLRRMGAIHAKDRPLSNRQLKAARIKILTSSSISNPTNAVLKPKKSKDHKRFFNRNIDWLERKRNTLMLVASLLAAMAFQAGINPPSGVWQDDSLSGSSSTASNDSNHQAGVSILADKDPFRYIVFITHNTVGFLASLSIILLLISGFPLRRRFLWVLTVIMWIAISDIACAYLVAVPAFTPGNKSVFLQKLRLLMTIYKHLKSILTLLLIAWYGLVLLIVLGHTIRLTIRFIKYLRKVANRLISTRE